MKLENIKDAIARCGSQSELARQMEVTPMHITRWIKYGVMFIDGKPYKPVVEIKRI
jgi:hypothetical protein